MRKFFLPLGIFVAFSILAQSSLGGSETRSASETRSVGRIPTFTLDQAILTSLQRNPTLLNAEQEIKRTKGVIIQVRAQVLPQVNVTANFDWTDPNLVNARTLSTTGGGPVGGTGTTGSLVEAPQSQVGDPRALAGAAAPTATPGARNVELSDISYSISVIGTQLIFNG